MWLEKGTFVEKVGFKPFVPSKIARIVRKACKPQTKDRYISASDMRDDLERLIPVINWIKVGDDEWFGTSNTQNHTAKITTKKNVANIVIKTNNRTLTRESKRFDSSNFDINMMNARAYLNYRPRILYSFRRPKFTKIFGELLFSQNICYYVT